jgi:tRNA(Ile)-lysidine synthase
MGLEGRKTLQDLMVDAKIPRELRDNVAVLAIDGEILWVPGRGGRRSNLAPVTPNTKRFLVIRFERPQSIEHKVVKRS